MPPHFLIRWYPEHGRKSLRPSRAYFCFFLHIDTAIRTVENEALDRRLTEHRIECCDVSHYITGWSPLYAIETEGIRSGLTEKNPPES